MGAGLADGGRGRNAPRRDALTLRTQARPLLIWLAKLLVTLFLLWLTLRKIPVHGIQAALVQVHLALAALSLGIFLCGSLFVEPARLAFASRLLAEPQPTFATWVRIFLESRPFYFVLPGSVAAEGMVWLRLRELHWRHASCAFVVLCTRIWGVGTWGLAAAYALTFPKGSGLVLAQAPSWMRSPTPWALGGFLAAASACLAPLLARRYWNLPLVTGRVGPTIAMILSSILSALIVTVGVQVASMAAGTPLPLHSALGLMALFNFAMIVPVSLGGFGLQEALILALGTGMGYPAPALVAFSALIHAQRLLLSLLGLALFLAARRIP